MNSLRSLLIGASLAAVECSTAGGGPLERFTAQSLQIHLYNLSGMEAETVRAATVGVDKIFTRAAIGIVWEQLPLALSEARLLDQGSSSFRPTYSGVQPYLVIRIVADLSPISYPCALGFALPFAQSGVNVEIVSKRLEAYASSAGVATHVVLAYSLAHEIGHVLLRSSNHGRSGVMQAHCDAASWRFASFGLAAFQPKEAAQMRREVLRLASHSIDANNGICAVAGDPGRRTGDASWLATR